MKLFSSIIICLLFFCQFSSAQDAQKTILLTNTKKIDEYRYLGVEGSPYLFSDWVKADIISVGGVKMEDVLCNYNAYEKEFEIKREGKYTFLQGHIYPRIEIYPAKNPGVIESDKEVIVLINNIHKKVGMAYTELHYENEDGLTLVNGHSIMKYENVVQTPGVPTKIIEFRADSKMHLTYDQGLYTFSLNKKQILKNFRNSKEIDGYLKKTKNKLKSPEDVAVMIQYLDENDMLQLK